MRRNLFLRVFQGVLEVDDYLAQKVDALNKVGLSTLQKTVAAVRIIAYGYAVDEYVRISESSASDCLNHFCKAVIKCFGVKYLRAPTVADLQRILQESAKRGFPGVLGSIDCYNWRWKNCPRAWKGSFKGIKDTSIVLEGGVSYDLWFWHASLACLDQ